MHLAPAQPNFCTSRARGPWNANHETEYSFYTSCPEKKSLEYFRYNFIKYWPIYEILLLLQSAGFLQ